MPAYGPAFSFSVPSGLIELIISRPWRSPISKSVGSWPGVTFRAPEPNEGSIASSGMIGSSRPMIGRRALAPDCHRAL